MYNGMVVSRGMLFASGLLLGETNTSTYWYKFSFPYKKQGWEAKRNI
jgi:hypothetical protein